jgi:hypothetical protein
MVLSGGAHAQTWQPVTGADKLEALFSDTVQTATLKDGVTAVATYNSDGTGELKAWGDTFPRSWEVQGDDQVCVGISDDIRCFTIEFDASSPNAHRARVVTTGETVIFQVEERQVTVTNPVNTSEGGASQPSAEEIAAKLANPNSPMASLTFRLQQRGFDGNLPNAGSQDSTTLVFQPSFPFSLEKSPGWAISSSMSLTGAQQRLEISMPQEWFRRYQPQQTMHWVRTVGRWVRNS